MSDQGSVGEADGWQVEDRAEVKRQPGAERVIACSGVDQEHVGHPRKGADRFLQERALAQREQPGLVPMPGLASDGDAAHDPRAGAERGARPAGLTRRAVAARAAAKADETAADHVAVPGELPCWRSRRRQLALGGAQLVGRDRPGSRRDHRNQGLLASVGELVRVAVLGRSTVIAGG
jgi:hypothetical protein